MTSKQQTPTSVEHCYCISIGERDQKLLKDFCAHFSRAVRAKSFEIPEKMENKCVANTDEAVRILKELLLHDPKTQSTATFIVFASGNLKQTEEDLLRAFDRQLRLCVFSDSQFRRCYFDDASVNELISDFTRSCKIELKQPPRESVSKEPTLHPVGEAKVADLCNRLHKKTLLPSSCELIEKLTVDGSFYKRIEVSSCTETSPEMFNMIFQLVAAAGKFNFSQFRTNVDCLLQRLIQTPDFLLEAADKCIYGLEDHDFEKISSDKLQQMRAATKDLVDVLNLLLDRFPLISGALRVPLRGAILILQRLNDQASKLFDTELRDKLNQLEQQWKSARSRIKQNDPVDIHKSPNQIQAQPDDFRQISVSPSKDELEMKTSVLQGNIVNGAYDDSEHYLDVQFRLMREDFIGPLKEGIKKFRAGQTRKIGMYVYRKVNVQPPQIDRKTGILSFPVTFAQMPYARWMNRLKYGSLVCLSSDDFQNDVVFATVANHTVEELKDGLVWLNFEFLRQTGCSDINYKAVYTMLESDVYFPAYRHVLSGLQAFPKNDPVPFEKYLVKCSLDLGKPKYLIDHKDPVVFSSVTQGQHSDVTDVFDLQQWPSKEQLGLDQSQMEALQLALTSELAIIQGPPGTGKTFLGHQLAKLLLGNESFWNPEKLHPILVVCFTNHALDQFLEGIIEFTTSQDDIIRIGGQSKSEKLLEYSLRKHRDRKHLLVPQNLRREIGKLKSERNRLENQLDYITTTLMNIQQKALLLNTTVVKRVINEDHARNLFHDGRMSDDKLLFQWLTTPPNSATDDREQYINVSLVRKLMDYEYGVSEAAAKIALSRTGNNNVDAAKKFLNENLTNPQLLNLDNGTARWPALQDVAILVRKGHSEQDAVTALEISGNVQLASEFLFHNRGEQNSTTKHVDQNQKDGAGNDFEKMEDDEDSRDNEDDFSVLDDEFFSAFCDSSSSPQMVQKTAGELFFPTHQMFKHENNEELYKQLLRLEKLRRFILSAGLVTEAEMSQVADVWKLPITDRWKMYIFWVNKIKKHFLAQLTEKGKSYYDLQQNLCSLTSMSDLQVLHSTKVIGMTTTGAAQNQALLRSIQPRIVIIEEAAQVLEAHLITSLSVGCEHVILIGDHQQLRPNINLYKLAKRFNFDISLFERLINNEFKHAMLNMQHRMRPEISGTLMPHFYPALCDHQSVSNYDNVQGIDKNMIFLNHTSPETQGLDSKSHLNQFEAEMAVGLSNYLLKQDYKVEQITVLCAYMDPGLVFFRKKTRGSNFPVIFR